MRQASYNSLTRGISRLHLIKVLQRLHQSLAHPVVYQTCSRLLAAILKAPHNKQLGWAKRTGPSVPAVTASSPREQRSSSCEDGLMESMAFSSSSKVFTGSAAPGNSNPVSQWSIFFSPPAYRDVAMWP